MCGIGYVQSGNKHVCMILHLLSEKICVWDLLYVCGICFMCVGFALCVWDLLYVCEFALCVGFALCAELVLCAGICFMCVNLLYVCDFAMCTGLATCLPEINTFMCLATLFLK